MSSNSHGTKQNTGIKYNWISFVSEFDPLAHFSDAPAIWKKERDAAVRLLNFDVCNEKKESVMYIFAAWLLF